MEIRNSRRWFGKGKRNIFAFLLLCGIFAFFFYCLNPPLWWYARNDLTSTRKFTSSEGRFSIEIPTSWYENKNPDMPSFGDQTYLNVQGTIRHYYKRRLSETIMYADLSVAMTVLPPGRLAPSVTELGNELDAQLAAKREVRARSEELLATIAPGGLPPGGFPGTNVTKVPSSILFEERMVNGYPWAKTTLTIGRETFIFWQAVYDGDGKLNHYIIAFATDNLSHYEAIFEKIMESFLFGR